MTNYWIFKVRDSEIGNEKMRGIEIYLRRMEDKFWGLTTDADNIGYLQPGDKVVYYLAGLQGHSFVGTASLGSPFVAVPEKDKPRVCHGKFFHPSHGVFLADVNVWKYPKPIRPLIKKLGFVADPTNWGAYLRGSITRISEKDYRIIVGQTEAEPKSIGHTVPNMINGTLTVLDTKNEIDKAQVLFEEHLSKVADRTENIWIGYQGGNENLKASWSKRLSIWWANSTSGNRYWNAFGTAEPEWGSSSSHNIICEVNPPFQGINRSIAGAFAKDPEGTLYLLHRGKIGGGKPGNSKTKFEKEFCGTWILAQDGPVTSRFALVASFASPQFADQVADFVHQIEKMKTPSIINAKETGIMFSEADHPFTAEFEGNKKYEVSRQIQAACNHGPVVNTLERMLKEKGVSTGKTSQIDLFTTVNGSLSELYEVKTDFTPTSIYGAIGQLFFHSTKVGKNCKLVAVFPQGIDKATIAIFGKLNIHCLTYTWNGKGNLKFDDLEV